MTHSRKLPLALLSLFVTAVALGTCRDPEDRTARTDTTGDTGAGPSVLGSRLAACALSSDSVRRITRRDFVRWAATLEYDSASERLGRPHGGGTEGIRVYRARDMGADRVDLADGCVISRIRSATADRTLGLGAGWTYVWADSSNPLTVVMVPEDEKTSLTEFSLSPMPQEPAEGSMTLSKYVCSDCGRDWCVYPSDTLRSTPELFASETGLDLRDVLGERVVMLSSALPARE